MGHLQILRGFHSPLDHETRALRIYLPDRFGENEWERYPVLYMQDGQNLFDHPETECYPSWGIDRAVDALVRSGDIRPWIVVGIDHRGVKRISEFSPWPEPSSGEPARAEQYEAFVLNHVIPWVQRSLPVRTEPEWTAIAGSSLGGLVSLHLGWRHPEIFGRVGALSPSVMWAGGRMFGQWNAHRPYRRLYVDAGATEHFEAGGMHFDYGRAVREFVGHLRNLGYREPSFRGVLEPGGQHSEGDWRRRAPDALRFLLG
ncbi:MAG: alpha/beta hydrolase [Myxococcales bacterium]